MRSNIDKVKLEFYKLHQDFKGDIALVAEEGELFNPEEINTNVKPSDEKEQLEEIIQKVNDRFLDDFTPADRVIVERLYDAFDKEPDLQVINMAKNNDKNMFVDSLFKEVFTKRVMEEYMNNTQAFEKLFGGDNRYFDTVYTLLAEEMYKKLRS